MLSHRSATSGRPEGDLPLQPFRADKAQGKTLLPRISMHKAVGGGYGPDTRVASASPPRGPIPQDDYTGSIRRSICPAPRVQPPPSPSARPASTPITAVTPVSAMPQAVSIATMLQSQPFSVVMFVNS